VEKFDPTKGIVSVLRLLVDRHYPSDRYPAVPFSLPVWLIRRKLNKKFKSYGERFKKKATPTIEDIAPELEVTYQIRELLIRCPVQFLQETSRQGQRHGTRDLLTIFPWYKISDAGATQGNCK